MAPRSPERLLGPLAAASIAALVVVTLWVRVSGAELFGHLQYLRQSLPFPVRFAVMGGPVINAVVLISSALLAAALVAMARGKARRLAQLSCGVAVLAPLCVGLVIARGVQLAGRLAVAPLDSDQARCECPRALLGVFRLVECHCDSSGAVRALIWPWGEIEGRPIADELRFPAGAQPVAEPRLVRETLLFDAQQRQSGRAFSLVGSSTAPVVRRFRTPCSAGVEGCGEFESAPAGAHRFQVRDDVECVEEARGTGALVGLLLLSLSRAVWDDLSPNAPLSPTPDGAAIPTDRPEIITSWRALERDQTSTLAAMVTGAGRAPAMRTGGVRVCRLPARADEPLLGGLSRAPATPAFIIRLTARP